jgi:hypothetical protein
VEVLLNLQGSIMALGVPFCPTMFDCTDALLPFFPLNLESDFGASCSMLSWFPIYSPS